MLRRLPVTNVYSIMELALLVVLAILGARLVWTVLTPVASVGVWTRSEPGAMASPGSMLREFDPFFRLSGQATAAPAVVTSLQLVLFGTRIDEAMGRASAIIAGADGVQQSYSVGEEIMPGVTLKQVAFDHVTVERGGASEDLFIDQSGGGSAEAVPPAPGGTAGLPSQPGQALTIDKIRAEIGFIPRIDSGRVSGLVVRPQGSGEAFRRAGLQDGDIVTAIGGRSIGGIADVDALAGQFASGGTILLTVERGATTLPLVITVAGQ